MQQKSNSPLKFQKQLGFFNFNFYYSFSPNPAQLNSLAPVQSLFFNEDEESTPKPRPKTRQTDYSKKVIEKERKSQTARQQPWKEKREIDLVDKPQQKKRKKIKSVHQKFLQIDSVSQENEFEIFKNQNKGSLAKKRQPIPSHMFSYDIENESDQQHQQQEIRSALMNKLKKSSENQVLEQYELKKGIQKFQVQGKDPSQSQNRAQQQKNHFKSNKIGLKKLDLQNFLQIKDDEIIHGVKSDDSILSGKPHSQAQQLKMRTLRNRRIGVYVKRVLRAAKSSTVISLRKLLISVLKNYQNDILLIKDPQKRIKRFDCIRRRTYECLSVLSAIHIVDKQKRFVSSTQKIDEIKKETSVLKIVKQKRQQLLNDIELRTQRINFKKNRLFNLLNNKLLLDTIINRSKVRKIQKQKISFYKALRMFLVDGNPEPPKYICKRSNFYTISMKVKNFEKISQTIVNFYLRCVINPRVSISDFIENMNRKFAQEYLEYLQKQINFYQTMRVRADLMRKLYLRKLGVGGPKKVLYNEKARQSDEKEKSKGKEKRRKKRKMYRREVRLNMKRKQKQRQQKERDLEKIKKQIKEQSQKEEKQDSVRS